MSARALLSAACAIGLVTVLTQTSCLALLCYEDESCADGSGGGSTATASVTASESATATDASGTSATQGGGGGGGGPPCNMPDLLTDEENCGACGHDCFGGECSNGECQPASIDADPTTEPVGPVAVLGGRVWLVVGNNGAARIKSTDVLFDASTVVISEASIPDTTGKWGRGPQTVYYAPQSTNGGAVVYSCRAAGCTASNVGVTPHVVGTAVIGDWLYMAVSQQNTIHRIALDGGVPAPGAEAEEVVSNIEQPAGGVHEMFADAAERLVFTTFGSGGCVYRKDPDSFPTMQASCNGSSVDDAGGIVALASDPQGNAFVATPEPHLPIVVDPAEVLYFIPGAQVRAPIAADESFIYARSGSDDNDGLVILDKARGEEVARISGGAPLSIDAAHPDFVFFVRAGTDPNVLYRLRKP